MINVGIVGSTGYGGCELVRFLLTHPNVNIEWVSSRTVSYTHLDVYKRQKPLITMILIFQVVNLSFGHKMAEKKRLKIFANIYVKRNCIIVITPL